MRTSAILILCLIGVASASAASTAVKATESKDIITDILGLFDFAVGLLQQFGIDIMDVLAQFLPAELVGILQILVDLGIVPIAKQDIISDLLAAIQLIIDQGLAAFDELLNLLPPEILGILQALFDLGLFPSRMTSLQSIDEWLMALIDVLFQLLGDVALDVLVQIAADFGIPASLIQTLWDMIVPPASTFKPDAAHAVRVDIIDWAIQLLTDLGLQALTILAEFLPAEILSLLMDLLTSGIIPFPK